MEDPATPQARTEKHEQQASVRQLLQQRKDAQRSEHEHGVELLPTRHEVALRQRPRCLRH